MSVTSGFFNSVNQDRLYDARDFGRIFDGIINDGVYMAIGSHFNVSPGSTGLSAVVGTGRAWFNHSWILNDGPFTMEFYANNTIYDRIDAIIFECDNTDAVRANTIKIVQGTPALHPVKPDISSGGGVYRYPIAYVTVRSNAASITAMDIENVVGTSECPFVTGPLEVIDIDYAFAQWNAEFNDWFTHLHNELDSNQAAHLQREIDTLNGEKQNNETWVEITLAAASWNNKVYSLEALYPSNVYDITAVLPTANTTPTMLNAWVAAEAGGYNSTNIIVARGTQPTVDIVIGICVRKQDPIISFEETNIYVDNGVVNFGML